MADLPTEEQLEQLYYDKGHDALVWFAWRCALRALPFLGRSPLRKIWTGDDRIQHIYSVYRVPCLLSQLENDSEKVMRAANVAAAAAENAANVASEDAEDAVFAAFAAADAAKATNAANTYANVNVNAATLYASAFVNAFATYANTFATYANTAAEAARHSIKQAAVQDYTFLRDQGNFDLGQWFSQPLWLNNEPDLIQFYRKSLIQDLREHDLSFLADDMERLWQGKPLGSHAKNYLESYSKTITNDSVALKQVILRGAEADNVVEEVHAVRVLLLGPGGAGKSSLADRLRGEPVKPAQEITEGVNYFQHEALNLSKVFPDWSLDHKALDLYLWDFGGQTIFHGLHSAFLHENCVYVLVVDSRHEQAPDEWLYQIRHLAGSSATVLLVTNWYEGCETKQNETRLLRKFPDLLKPIDKTQADSSNFFYFSCLDSDSEAFKGFIEQLVEASLDSKRKVLKDAMTVQRALKSAYQNEIFLDQDSVEELIEETADFEDSVKVITPMLKQLGFLVEVTSDENNYCLRPEWAIDNAYKVLYSRILRESNGKLPLKQLKDYFKADIKKQHTGYLVDFLQERSLCKKLKYGKEYFFADAATANEPKVTKKYFEDKGALILRFNLPYLPLGFHARLVNRLFNQNTDSASIRDEDEVWRQGFLMRHNTSVAVVHYHLRKTQVEIRLLGELGDFSELLQGFYGNLKDVTEFSATQIYPMVALNQQLFSVHSSEDLIDVLRSVDGYGEFYKRVKEMSGDIHVGDNSQVIVNSKKNKVKYESKTTHIQINADQREQIASVVECLFQDAARLQGKDLVAIGTVKSALESGANDEKSQTLLSKLWNGLDKVTGFANNAIGVGDFVAKNYDKVMAAMTVAVAASPMVNS